MADFTGKDGKIRIYPGDQIIFSYYASGTGDDNPWKHPSRDPGWGTYTTGGFIVHKLVCAECENETLPANETGMLPCEVCGCTQTKIIQVDHNGKKIEFPKPPIAVASGKIRQYEL